MSNTSELYTDAQLEAEEFTGTETWACLTDDVRHELTLRALSNRAHLVAMSASQLMLDRNYSQAAVKYAEAAEALRATLNDDHSNTLALESVNRWEEEAARCAQHRDYYCGEVRPQTLGYQQCTLTGGHDGDHQSQDGKQWCDRCETCASLGFHGDRTLARHAQS